jgi:hypothetical protein
VAPTPRVLGRLSGTNLHRGRGRGCGRSRRGRRRCRGGRRRDTARRGSGAGRSGRRSGRRSGSRSRSRSRSGRGGRGDRGRRRRISSSPAALQAARRSGGATGAGAQHDHEGDDKAERQPGREIASWPPFTGGRSPPSSSGHLLGTLALSLVSSTYCFFGSSAPIAELSDAFAGLGGEL